MPLKAFIKLKARESIDTSIITPDKVHGLFFNLIGEELAKKLHEDYRNIKPYTIYCGDIFNTKTAKVINIEVNLLDENLIPEFLSQLVLNRKENFLNLNNREVPISHNLTVPQNWLKPYSVLYKETPLSTKVTLKFLSPTTFRREQVDYPFPSPELVFKGLVKKWLAFSNIPIGADLREYYSSIEIEKFNLRTTKVVFSSIGKLTAFVGEITYNLSRIKNREIMRWFNILLELSKWSGIGKKTTMGLGKVKVLSKEV
ncbi:MAG: CRISPR-associated endoribonuclease Cas6 [Aquificae bacterium]|nr:CRISPR-associated endoribonuclease Cas6 [Aquificota bacterium]